MPQREKEPIRHIRLVFCIDMSSSMQGKNEAAVKEGMKAMLSDAVKRVGDEVQIEVAVVGFNQDAQEISSLKSLSMHSVEEINSKVNGYRSNGMTSIQAGILSACGELEKEGTHGVSALILLTDGADTQITDRKGKELSKKVKELGAQFFAIGIEGYDKNVLERLTNKANIIDTTKGTSIVEAISTLYHRAIAKFSDLKLRCPVKMEKDILTIGELYSPTGARIWAFNRNGEAALGELAEGETREFQICINYEAIKNPIDLSEVNFELTFKDPRGIEGRTSLPWKPGTIMDPRIFSQQRGQYFPEKGVEQ